MILKNFQPLLGLNILVRQSLQNKTAVLCWLLITSRKTSCWQSYFHPISATIEWLPFRSQKHAHEPSQEISKSFEMLSTFSFENHFLNFSVRGNGFSDIPIVSINLFNGTGHRNFPYRSWGSIQVFPQNSMTDLPLFGFHLSHCKNQVLL